jgi:uncharacterized membrane protein
MAENPYAAPKSYVEDARTPLPDGVFLPEGRGVAAGNGWRWIADAWAFMADQRWTFVGVFVLLMVVNIAAQLVPIVGPLAMTLLTPLLVGGFVLGCEAVRRGEPFEVAHLFAGFRRHSGKLIALGALSLVFGILFAIIMILIVGVSVVPLMTGLGEPTPDEVMAMMLPMLLAVLVILALSLPVSMAMLFATPLIVLNDSDVLPALKTSFLACLKNVMPFLVWSLAMLVLGFVASLPLFLGWLLLVPVMMVSLYLSYRDVFHEV